MNSTVNSLMIGREEMRDAREREQVRRKGHNFIKVINRGSVGLTSGIHDVEDVRIIETQDPDTGKAIFTPQIQSAALTFTYDEMSGDYVAFVLDSEFNRFFLSRHLYLGLYIDDSAIREAVEKLMDIPYQVEVSHVEELRRKRARLSAEIKHLEREVADVEDVELRARGKVRRSYRTRAMNKDLQSDRLPPPPVLSDATE